MKVAIAGFGIEGESSYAYWRELGADLTIFDEHNPARGIPSEAKSYFGPDAFKKMNGFDLIIRTASLNPNKILTDGTIWSATNEFFAKCPAPIIGVTGTKGKGTTCSLIYEMLKAAGKKVHLVGNIGVPALSSLKDIEANDIVVFELSSFQLWDIQKSPQTAVILMIEPDHMDIHVSLEEYIDAKANIGRHQSKNDLMIYHPSNTFTEQAAAKSPAQKMRYLTPEGAHIEKGQIVIDSHLICAVDEVGLVGKHNLENICAAITAAWHCTHNVAAIKGAVTDFTGLPHRLELVRETGGVMYFDDSFSSAPGATIAAMRAFTQPEIVIMGGYDRGLDFKELTTAVVEQPNIKKIVLIGQTADRLHNLLIAAGLNDSIIEKPEERITMQSIVGLAQSLAEDGDIVLLSPGCPSFDMFKDFKDRGQQFKAVVEVL